MRRLLGKAITVAAAATSRIESFVPTDRRPTSREKINAVAVPLRAFSTEPIAYSEAKDPPRVMSERATATKRDT